MKSYRKELWFEVPGRRAFINITPQVEECLRESGVVEGLVLGPWEQIFCATLGPSASLR